MLCRNCTLIEQVWNEEHEFLPACYCALDIINDGNCQGHLSPDLLQKYKNKQKV